MRPSYPPRGIATAFYCTLSQAAFCAVRPLPDDQLAWLYWGPLHAVGVAAHHLPPPLGRFPPRLFSGYNQLGRDTELKEQAAKRGIPLAEHGDVDNTGYRERGVKIREESPARAIALARELDRKPPRTPGDPGFDFYLDLLGRIRQACPLTNAATCPPRSPKPM